jgi:hypothetical protein
MGTFSAVFNVLKKVTKNAKNSIFKVKKWLYGTVQCSPLYRAFHLKVDWDLTDK